MKAAIAALFVYRMLLVCFKELNNVQTIYDFFKPSLRSINGSELLLSQINGPEALKHEFFASLRDTGFLDFDLDRIGRLRALCTRESSATRYLISTALAK